MDQPGVIGFDIAKSFFQVHGVDDTGSAIVRRKLRRAQIEEYFSQLKPTLVGLEACGSSHHWARILTRLGHSVKIVPARFVKPFLKSNKSDANDAEAICDAVQRPNMRFVPIKSELQQAVLMVHRTRDLLTRQRTMMSNALRGHFAEFGIVAPAGPAGIAQLLKLLQNAEVSEIPNIAQDALRLLAGQIRSLSASIKRCESKIMQWHRKSRESQRLATIPGVGPLTATALVATIGDARQFQSGRQLAAWIGLVPKQLSSGGKPRLGGISKRGNSYLRTLLFLGARASMRFGDRSKARCVQWAMALSERKPFRVAAIALAAKMARIAWALLRRDQDFRFQISTPI
jgi:transposase